MIRLLPTPMFFDEGIGASDRIMAMVYAIDRYSDFGDGHFRDWIEDKVESIRNSKAIEGLDALLEESRGLLTEGTYWYVKGLIMYGPLKKEDLV